MKKITVLAVLAAATNLAFASETVEINKSKYTKYSDSEVRSFIVKMNSVQSDMTVDQVVSILGKPIREQLVSNSPPQRIVVYPLGIVISLYRSSRTRDWLVTAPALYGSPLCQREDGTPQQNAIGAEVVEYPSINCIPRKFGPPAPKSALPKQATSANWQLLKESPPDRNGPGTKYLYDSKSVDASGKIKKVRLLTSYPQDQQTFSGTTYRSIVTLTLVSCEDGRVNKENLKNTATEYYRGELGTGAIVKSYTDDDSNWGEDYGGHITAKLCQ